MNQRNLLIASVVLNVLLIALVFFVKQNAIGQAQEIATKAQERASYQIGQARDNIDNNNVLWSLIDSTWKSQDRSVAAVKRMANALKLPRCGGKACAGSEDEARLKVDGPAPAADDPKKRILRVGWGSSRTSIKYAFNIVYGEKERFLTIDASDLLGKTTGDSAEEAEGEAEGPAEEAVATE